MLNNQYIARNIITPPIMFIMNVSYWLWKMREMYRRKNYMNLRYGRGRTVYLYFFLILYIGLIRRKRANTLQNQKNNMNHKCERHPILFVL